MNVERVDHVRARLRDEAMTLRVWRWTAASEFGAGGCISLHAAGFSVQTSLSVHEMRALAKGLLECAAGVEADSAPGKVAA